MVAYVQYGQVFTVGEGGTEKDIVSPVAGVGELIQSLRIRYAIDRVKSSGELVKASVRVEISGGLIVTTGQVPLPPVEEVGLVDVLPYLSNLSAFGISNPDKITAKINSTLLTDESVTFYGFGISGAEV